MLASPALSVSKASVQCYFRGIPSETDRGSPDALPVIPMDLSGLRM